MGLFIRHGGTSAGSPSTGKTGGSGGRIIHEPSLARANAGRIAQTAIEAGELTPLRQAGFEKVRQGVTTISEILRATKA